MRNIFGFHLFLPGESQGWGNMVGCCLWGRTDSDTFISPGLEVLLYPEGTEKLLMDYKKGVTRFSSLVGRALAVVWLGEDM